MKCDYGCGKEATYQIGNGKWCCQKSYNSCEAVRKKNSLSITKAHKKGKIYSFTNEDRKKHNDKRKGIALENIFVEKSIHTNHCVRKALIEWLHWEEKCNECGINEWRGKKLTVELEHKNGNNRDNRLENLIFLCPNCHSQTETYRSKNVYNKGKTKVKEEVLLEALKNNISIRKALMEVGLTPKGKNYERVYRIKDKFKLYK